MEAFAVLLLITFVALVILVPAAQSGFKAGIAGVVYRNTGTYGSPTWTPAPIVADVQFGLPWDFADASSRQTRAKLNGKTQVDAPIQLVCRADDADVAYGAFVDAAVSPTAVLDLLVLDGPLTKEGTRGLRAHFLLSIAQQPQNRGDGVYTTFDLKFGVDSAGAVPNAIVVGSGSAITGTPF